jgi:hypothetical protein
MNQDARFQDSASAYRLHRSVTDEAEAIATTIWQYVSDEFRLIRNHLRLLDAGTGDGRVLKGVLEKALRAHQSRPCEVVLKEYDFQHIEVLLQNVAPMLRAWPQLALFVTNRTFRQLQGFPADLCRANTVCFDDVAGYRMLAMVGTSSLLNQEDALLHSFPRVEDMRQKGGEAFPFTVPQSDRWDTQSFFLPSGPSITAAPTLQALGDEIRAREIYDELAATGGSGKHFTVTIARQENASPVFPLPREFFWDLAIVSHAFHRDKDPGWICRNVLSPLCQGLAVGGVLVNVHALDEGPLGELKREIFGTAFPFHAPPHALAREMAVALEREQFQLLPCQEFWYQGHLTAETFARLEPWECEVALHQMAISVAYHLQIPEEAWIPQRATLQAKIRGLLEKDGTLSYCLSIGGVKRRE